MVYLYPCFGISIPNVYRENIMSRTKRNLNNINISKNQLKKAESKKHLEELIYKFSYKCRCEWCLSVSRTKIVDNLLKKEIKDFDNVN